MRLARLNPQSRMLARRLPKPAPGTPGKLPPGEDRDPDGTPDDVPPGSQGIRKGKEEGQAARVSAREGPSQDQPEPAEEPPSRFAELNRVEAACRAALGDKAPVDVVIGPMALLVRDGIPLDRVSVILQSEARRTRRSPIRTWSVWASIVREKHAGAGPALRGAKPAPPPDDSPRQHFPGGYSATESVILACQKRGQWIDEWGPKPGDPNCRIPQHLWVEPERLH